MSKQKQQGTALESSVVQRAKLLLLAASRLPEGGSKDCGDVAVEEWFVECKATQTLSPQAVLAKAIAKSGSQKTVVWWKRLVPVAGSSRRKPVAGVAEVVILPAEEWLDLVAEHKHYKDIVELNRDINKIHERALRDNAMYDMTKPYWPYTEEDF